ncbi:acr-7 [Symbiodinium pilosum]|uniref:Acr-7 protein n=1 Tax=Symbiodinium pilosum TaxID=2952 RepID=A0A812W3G4_SYMPI|nr:acr-7 [Symbiodinium pilosum]
MALCRTLCSAVLLHVWTVASQSGAFTESYTDDATRLRTDLLRNYDSVVPPRSKRAVEYSKAGTDVAMEIRIFKVQGVDASVGQMRLKVWVRMSWYDTRLSWDPAAYGNITSTHFRGMHATNAENSEIWLPDVQLYNANVGNEFSLDNALAVAYSDGSVFWSRPGLLDTLCKFSGLVAFPHDVLKCSMEWGGWTYSGGYQGINLSGKGYSEATTEDTAGSSYQEYSIEGVEVETKTNFYDAYPSEPWTLVKYTVKLGRASFYYSLLIIFPTTLITYLSFGVFFMSHEVGERLSFGITLLLVIEVMKTTGASFVPVCGELLWIDLFMLVNTVFCCASLVETMLVLFFAFHIDQHFLPKWLAWAAPWCLCRPDPNLLVESNAGRIYRELRHSEHKLTASNTFIQKGAKIQELSQSNLSATDTEKLIFFENLFYLLDSDSNGLITVEDAACMLSFVNLGLSRVVLEEILLSAWDPKQLFDCRDFLEICVELMWTTPFTEIKLGTENYISSQKLRPKSE